MAAASIVAPITSLGSASIAVRSVSRRAEASGVVWGRGIAVILLLGTPAALIIAALLPALSSDDIPLLSVALIAWADLVPKKVWELDCAMLQGAERYGGFVVAKTLMPCGNLASLLAFWLVGAHDSLPLFGAIYLTVTSLVAIGSAALVGRLSRTMPKLQLPNRLLVKDGLAFSFGIAARNVSADVDKLLVAHYMGSAAVGNYALAYRALSMSVLPVLSLLEVIYAKVFRTGSLGRVELHGRLRPAVRAACVYGAVVGVVMWMGADLLPGVLGAEYRDSAMTLRWLAALPLLLSLQYVLGDVLTGADYQHLRAAIAVLGTVTNLVVNIALIPVYGLVGACIATLVAEALVVVLLLYFSKGGGRGAQAQLGPIG